MSKYLQFLWNIHILISVVDTQRHHSTHGEDGWKHQCSDGKGQYTVVDRGVWREGP